MSPVLERSRAVVFDAYGTLFDVASAASAARDELGERWQPLAELWRAKQLQYTWLRSLMRRHADFAAVTADALDFALEALALADPALRARLLDLYERLGAYPEVPEVLARLRRAGRRLAILSNGSPAMLDAAVRAAGLDGAFEAVLSVEDVGVYKPDPKVYAIATARLGVAAGDVAFVSSNGWDASGAKAFGFGVVWCNRAGQPRERLGLDPDAEIATLEGLPGAISVV
jgi:2-haloacid dehalogenase